MSGKYKPNPNAMSSKGGVKLYNTQWNTIREQLEIMGRKRAPTECEKFFAPLEIAGAANEHFNGRFAQGAAGIAFPWAGGLEYFKKEYAKKDPITRPTGFKAIACQLELDSETARCRTWANEAFVAYTTWLQQQLTTSTAPQVPAYGDGKFYDRYLQKCLQFCYFFICYFAEDYNTFGDAYAGCQAKYREVFRIQAREGGTKSMKRAKDIMERQATQRWCVHMMTEGKDDLRACPENHRHVLGQRKFINDGYVEDLIKLFLSHEPHGDDVNPGPQDVDAGRDWLDAILDWREHEMTDPAMKAATKWLTNYEWDPDDKNHSINPGNLRIQAMKAKENVVITEMKTLMKICKRTEDDSERRKVFEAYRVLGEASGVPLGLLIAEVPNYKPVPTKFIAEMNRLYKVACVAKDSTELSEAYGHYTTHALKEPSFKLRPRPLLKRKQELLEAADRQREAALSAPAETPEGDRAYLRYRAILKKLQEKAFADLELPNDLPETHLQWYNGLVNLGDKTDGAILKKLHDLQRCGGLVELGDKPDDATTDTTQVSPEEPKTSGDAAKDNSTEDTTETPKKGEDKGPEDVTTLGPSTPAKDKSTEDTTETPKKDDDKGPEVVTPDETLGASTPETGPLIEPTTLNDEMDTETHPKLETENAPAVFLDESKLAEAYANSALFVHQPIGAAIGAIACSTPNKETPPGLVRKMEVEKQKEAQKKDGIDPLSLFTEEQRKQRIQEIQQGRKRLEAERLVAAKKLDSTVTEVEPIDYPPIELFVIYGELHDKGEWDRKSQGWKHSFHHHTTSEYDRGHQYPKKHWDHFFERFDIHQTRLPTTDHLENMEHDYWGSEASADMVQVNQAVFFSLRGVLDQPWARGAYQEDHMFCIPGSSGDANELTTMAVYVGICLGLFRPEWIEEASGNAAEQSLLNWMSRPMRTGFTAYMEAFYLMAISHEPRVKKFIYDRCLVGATTDPNDSSLPPVRQYQSAVVQQAARRIYAEREAEGEPNALKTLYEERATEGEPDDEQKTLQEQGYLNILKPMKLSRRGLPLKLLVAPSYQTKKRKWSDKDFSLGEHELDELAFKKKTLGRRQAMNDQVRTWLAVDTTEMQEMNGWFETGKHGAHSRWDRSRGFYEKPKEAQPDKQDMEA